MSELKEIYGWHIIHAPTGLPYAFCQRERGGKALTEEDALDGLDRDEFVLVPLVRAGSENPTMRGISRANYTSSNGNTIEAMNAGSFQRIADATEKMAQRHTDLIRDRDQYERWYNEEAKRRKHLERSLAAHKGQITKLKKRIAAANLP